MCRFSHAREWIWSVQGCVSIIAAGKLCAFDVVANKKDTIKRKLKSKSDILIRCIPPPLSTLSTIVLQSTVVGKMKNLPVYPYQTGKNFEAGFKTLETNVIFWWSFGQTKKEISEFLSLFVQTALLGAHCAAQNWHHLTKTLGNGLCGSLQPEWNPQQ